MAELDPFESGEPVLTFSIPSPSSPQVMNAFYRRLFPYRPFFLWLNQDHGELPSCHPSQRQRVLTSHILVPAKLFTHREFAFTLAGDIYIRYNSFHSADDFKKEVLRLNPSRFEIGPQYSARVCRFPCLIEEPG
jgi:DNA primase small subunit